MFRLDIQKLTQGLGFIKEQLSLEKESGEKGLTFSVLADQVNLLEKESSEASSKFQTNKCLFSRVWTQLKPRRQGLTEVWHR